MKDDPVPKEGLDPIKNKVELDKNKAYNLMLKIRKRKGLKEEMPKLEDYFDKL